jgi:hypothetical protein
MYFIISPCDAVKVMFDDKNLHDGAMSLDMYFQKVRQQHV